MENLNKDILLKNILDFINENYYEKMLEENNLEISSLEEISIKQNRTIILKSIVRSIENFNDIIGNIEATFSERILKLISERNKDEVEIYKKAFIDRKLFSKIRSNKNYSPSKATIISLSLALELSYDETNSLLLTAGFALSKSSRFDLIIEYCLRNNIYNILEVNDILFHLEEKLLNV